MNQNTPKGGLLSFTRTAAQIALPVGAVGSLGLMLRAGQRTPRFLLLIFVVWVLAPFMVLVWAHVASKRWSILTRTTLYCVTVVVALGSLAAYGNLIKPPAGSANAAMFVLVPPVSCVLVATAIGIAAFVSRARSEAPTS